MPAGHNLHVTYKTATPVLRPLAVAVLTSKRKNQSYESARGGDTWCRSTGSRQCAARRRSELGASTSYAAEVVEEKEFYRELAEAASRGDVTGAEELLESVEASGGELTPQAYHGLIFAVAKQGDVLAAQELLHEVESLGMQALPESYAAVILSAFQNREAHVARNVFLECMELPINRYPAWDAWVRGLVTLGNQDNFVPEPEKEVSPGDVRTMAKAEKESMERVKRLREEKEAELARAEMRKSEEMSSWGLPAAAEGDDGGATWEIRRPAVVALIYQALEYGRQEGWYPNLDTYEDLLGFLCQDPEDAVQAENILWSDLVVRADVEPETRHYNTILRAEAVFTGLIVARDTMQEMVEGKRGKNIFPNIESFNALLEGCLSERLMAMSYAVEDLEETVAELITSGIKMNKRTHALLLMFYLADADLDHTLFELREMHKLAAEGHALDQVPDEQLAQLVTFLMDHRCVLEVMQLLLVMRQDSRPLPQDLSLVDEEGHSFFAAWLHDFLSARHLDRNNEGLEKYAAEEEDEEWVEVDGVMVAAKSQMVIDPETGVAVHLNDMTMPQMRAELTYKGLPTEGLKRELTRRLQQTRGNAPRSVHEAMTRQRMDAQNKRMKLQQRRAERVEAKSISTEFQYVQTTMHGRKSNAYFQVHYVDPAVEAEATENEFFRSLHAMNLSPYVLKLMKEYRAAFNIKDTDAMAYLDAKVFDTDEPGFQALNPHFDGRDGFGMRLEWPDYGKGGKLALFMMQTALQLGGGTSFEDFLEINKACITEDDPETAFALLSTLQPFALEIDPDELRVLYTNTLMLCFQCERSELAVGVADMMHSLDLQPTGILDDPEVVESIRQARDDVQNASEAELDAYESDLEDGSLTPELRNLEGMGVEDELVESVTAVDSTSGQLMQLVVDHTTGEVHPLLEYVEVGEEILQIEERLRTGDEEADDELFESSDAELGSGSSGDERLLGGDVESEAGSGESGVDEGSQDGENGKANGSYVEDE